MRRVLLLLSVASCLLPLAACRVPGAVRPAVKIGLVAPFEGRYRYVGYDLFPAFRLAVREANAEASSSYVVEWVAYDDGADPEMAPLQARKLAVDPEVAVAIGHFREETTQAALPAYTEAGLPLVAPAVMSQGLEGTAFRFGPGAEGMAAALLEGVEQAALITEGGPLGEALLTLADERGVDLVLTVAPTGEGWLEAAVAADPPVVLCDADPVAAGEAVAALRAAGWTGEFRGGPELAAFDFVTVAGEAAEGAVFVSPWPPPNTGQLDPAFVAAYEAVSGGTPPGPLALPAYEATRQVVAVLLGEIAARGRPSREGMAQALAANWVPWTGRLRWYRIEAGRATPQTP